MGLSLGIVLSLPRNPHPRKATLTGRVRSINGRSAGAVTRDDVLDDITLYWLTNTGVSAARFYWEYRKKNLLLATGQVRIPTAVSVFPARRCTSASWKSAPIPNSLTTTRQTAGPFAAWEEPQLVAKELRASFRRSTGTPDAERRRGDHGRLGHGDGGPRRHHLQAQRLASDASVVIVGFAAEGTLRDNCRRQETGRSSAR